MGLTLFCPSHARRGLKGHHNLSKPALRISGEGLDVSVWVSLGVFKRKEMSRSESKHEDIMLGDEEEEIFAEDSGSAEDKEFDMIVGILEEILLQGEIMEIQKNFCERHCDIFEDTEENKLEYTEIFRQYTETVEASLEAKLQARIPGFRMQHFESLLKSREEDEISADIFDILLSFGDFNEFKQ